RVVDPDLHGRFVRAWLERRTKGNGADHADLDRCRANRLCAEPCLADQRDPGVFGGDRTRPVRVRRACRDDQGGPGRARAAVTDAVRARQIEGAETYAALSTLADDVAAQIRQRGELQLIPAAAVQNVRNDMYLVSEAIRLALKTGAGLTSQ